MKAHVVLANPPYPEDVPQAVFIPLGISYLVAVLERDGYQVDVVDCQIAKLSQKDLEDKFRSLKADIVGATAATVTYFPALQVLKAAKAALPNCVTMIGGPHVTVLDERTFMDSQDVDIVVRGEGEQTMLELARLVSEDNLKALGKVLGITYKRDGQVIRTADRPFLEDIDTLPYPAHKHFDVSRYRINGKLYMPIITSRGCPFNCAFCLASKMCPAPPGPPSSWSCARGNSSKRRPRPRGRATAILAAAVSKFNGTRVSRETPRRPARRRAGAVRAPRPQHAPGRARAFRGHALRGERARVLDRPARPAVAARPELLRQDGARRAHRAEGFRRKRRLRRQRPPEGPS